MRARKAVIPATGLGTTFLPATKPIRAIRYTGSRDDVGSRADWLRASVRLAVNRPDLGPQFRALPREMVQSW